MGVPAVAFALPHWGNLAAYGSNLTRLAPLLFMGITYGWAARRTGSVWLPFGLHSAVPRYAERFPGLALLCDAQGRPVAEARP